MPIHDWTRVSPGTWHAFHLSWISEIQKALNDGLLPQTYCALAEQFAGPFGPDVLTLQEPDSSQNGTSSQIDPIDEPGGVAVAQAPPRVRLIEEVEFSDYARKRRTIVIRHTSNDRIVALLELVSPGNKSSLQAINSFIEKAHESVLRGYHLLIVDLFPPGPRDPNGIHALIWSEMGGGSFTQPPSEPLTLVAYAAGHPNRAYIEPTAVWRSLIDMPLFLTPDRYVNVPLEKTYAAAFQGVPRKWKAVLETQDHS
jgi:hypothetical protein